MGTCPQCGRPVDDSLHFCPSCGASRTAAPATPRTTFTAVSAPAPAPAQPPAAWSAPPAARTGPTGRVQAPIMVLVLTFVTLGIYGLPYWWRVSKEVDDYMGRPGHAHRRIRLGVFLLLGALAALVVGFVVVFAAAASAEEAAATGAEPAGAGFAGFALVVMLAGYGLLLAAVILWYMGMWRVWKSIEEDERRRAVADPLSPGMMLVFMLVPILNYVTTWVALYQTQKHLNAMWGA